MELATKEWVIPPRPRPGRKRKPDIADASSSSGAGASSSGTAGTSSATPNKAKTRAKELAEDHEDDDGAKKTHNRYVRWLFASYISPPSTDAWDLTVRG